MSADVERRRVMFICSVSPFPKAVGKTLMIGGICEFLRDSEWVDALKLMCFEPVPSGFGVTAELLPKPGAVRRTVNTLFHSFLLRIKGLQESFYWSGRARQKIASSIEEFAPDIVIYDTVRTGQFLIPTNSKIRHVLYMDDLFSVRYERILAASREFPDVSREALGNFAERLPSVFMVLFERMGWVRSALLKMEKRLIAATETRCPSKFDRCLLISSAEAEVLQLRTGAQNITDIPPRIERSAGPPQRTWKGAPDFVFLGALNLSHNAFGIEHFIADHFESILKVIPDVRLFIVGSGASANLVRLAAHYPHHVELMGFVEDVDAVLLQCCAMVSPLLFGSGIKIKAIDALRCGVPLISTAEGVEGLKFEVMSGIRLVESPAKFPSAMHDLLCQEANATASRANLQAFQEFYSSAAVDPRYRRAFLDVQ
jgi:glycosyltransferase involved in cell wall biosynthesis